jgi:hypothetical protein
LAINGTVSRLLDDIVFTATVNGLTQDLTQAIKSGLGLGESDALPTNIKISKIVKMKSVEATSSNVVTSELNDYDIVGYALNDSSFVLDEAVVDTTLSDTEFSLPTTSNNNANFPVAGQKMQISFYVIIPNTTETLSVSTNGVLYTDYSFSTIETISVASGFRVSGLYTGAISVLPMNQPASGSKYKVSYNYTAPKPGERIDVRYNYNSLVGESTLRMEPYRQITADVLAKEAPYILIDVAASIIVNKSYTSSSSLVLQNIADQIATTINNQKMGATLHASDLINAAYQVTGLDSIRITTFNKADYIGQVLQIQALRNQYLRANSIIVTIE